MKKITIIEMDDRESTTQLDIDLIGVDIELVRKRLEVGDYIYKDLIVERKTINDFCSSILDKRIEHQVENMKKSGKRCYIFLIGRVKDRTIDIHSNCVLGKIMSIIFKHDIKFMWVEDEDEFLWCLKNLCDKYDEVMK